MLLRLLSTVVLWVGASGACISLLANPYLNVTSGAVTSWNNSNFTVGTCGNKANGVLGNGTQLKLIGTGNASLYQTVNLSTAVMHNINCDFYDYEYGYLAVLNGGSTGVPNFAKVPLVAGQSFVARNFTPTGVTTVLISGRRVCVQSCVLTTVACTSAPTTRAPTTRAPTTKTPTRAPTTRTPTLAPTRLPTAAPTQLPTTAMPTQLPTRSPTMFPTNSPTVSPTLSPTVSPTVSPTDQPTVRPTSAPTTRVPTNVPTRVPTTRTPSLAPTTRMPTTTKAPTFAPLTAPLIVLNQSLNAQLTVNVSSTSPKSYTARCIAHTDPAYTNVTAFWAYSNALVIESPSLPFLFVFTNLQSNTAYIINCGLYNGGYSPLATATFTTRAKCSDNVVCAPASQCMDTNDGSQYMCAPYIEGAFMSGSPSQCRHSGGTSRSTNLTTTMGGDRIVVCVGVGNNTNSSGSYVSLIQVFYGLNTSLTVYSCLSPTFGPVVNGWMLVNCTTSPGVGRVLVLSLQFSPLNSNVVLMTGSDSVGYPYPIIFPNTSRLASSTDPWTDTLVSITTDPVWVSFNVANIAPSSPLLRVFYGPPPTFLQRECTLDRIRTNFSTIVCLTDPSTVYNALPYNWTVLAGDVMVTGTDTFDLSATSPRVDSIDCSGCAQGPGGRLYNCPTIGSTPVAPVTLTMRGYNFGLNYTVRVYVDGNNCPVVGSVPGANMTVTDTLYCQLPAGTGYNRSVFMQTAAQFSSPLPLLSYSGPVISKICGCDTTCILPSLRVGSCNRGGGDSVDIYGSSFGTQNSAILVGSASCSNVVHDPFAPDTHLTCKLAAGASLDSSVIVIQQNGPNSASGPTALVSYRMCAPGTIQVGSLTTCADCLSGTYAPLAGLQACLPCPPGSISNHSAASACLDCDVGTYQQLPNQTDCMDCSAGTFAGVTGLSACVDCLTGTHASDPGASMCDPCVPGYYANASGLQECDPCGVGTLSSAYNQKECSACPPGTYNGDTGQSDCTNCDPGRYSSVPMTSSCSYCDNGTIAASEAQKICVACSPGTYNGETGQSECTNCDPGKYASVPGAAVCVDCENGTIAASEAQKICVACSPGTYANQTGQSECVNCDPGTFVSSPGASVCMMCENGTVAVNEAQKLCASCLPGTYANSSGLSGCSNCAPGSYASSPGSSGCMQCENGTIAASEAQKICVACLPGTFASTSGLSKCSNCVPGEYVVFSGQSGCLKCEAGRFSNVAAQPQCTNCPPGFYSNETAATGCENCEIGTYQASPGGDACMLCPQGFISAVGGTACSICPAGTSAGNATCEVCEPGRYQSSPGQRSCLPCGLGTAVASEGAKECPACDVGLVAPELGMLHCQACPPGAAQFGTPPSCACNPGFYMNADFTRCLQCVEGMQCVEYGLVERALVAKQGYLKVENTTMFLACLTALYCPGGLTRCAPFREGPLCNNCVEDYRPEQGSAGCSPCPKQSLSAFYIFIIAILILAALTLLYAFVIRSDIHILHAASGGKQRQWWQESEKEDIMDRRTSLANLSVEEDATNSEPVLSPTVPLKVEVRVKKTLSYQFKILITFLQLITALLSLSSVNWPPSFQSFISNFDFVNLSFLPWNYVGCLTRLRLFDKIMLTSFFPPLLLIAIGGPLLLVLWCLDKKDDADLELNRVKRAQAKNIFWRVIVFTVFLSYPAVSRQIIAYFRCVAVPESTSVTYYLRDSFWEQCYDATWYSLLVPVVLALLFYPVGIPLCLLYALLHNRHRFRVPAVLYSLGLAYSGFHPEFWWFELLDMLHKLVLGCLLALLPEQSAQIAVALAVSAAYALVLFISAPYLRDSDNQLHLLSQVEVFLLVLSMQSSGEVAAMRSGSLTDVLISGVLIIMVIVVFIVFLFVTVRYLRLSYLRKVQKKRQLMIQRTTAPPQLSSNRLSRSQSSLDESLKSMNSIQPQTPVQLANRRFSENIHTFSSSGSSVDNNNNNNNNNSNHSLHPSSNLVAAENTFNIRSAENRNARRISESTINQRRSSVVPVKTQVGEAVPANHNPHLLQQLYDEIDAES